MQHIIQGMESVVFMIHFHQNQTKQVTSFDIFWSRKHKKVILQVMKEN